jgi:hypothetical protein
LAGAAWQCADNWRQKARNFSWFGSGFLSSDVADGWTLQKKMAFEIVQFLFAVRFGKVGQMPRCPRGQFM